MKVLVLVLTFLFSLNSFASNNDSYFAHHEKGWHWYNEIIEKVKKKKVKKQVKPKHEEIDNKETNPVEIVKAIRERYSEARAKSYLNPSYENMVNLIRLQNKITNQASKFSKQWMLAMLKNPELNYDTVHPVQHLARQIYIDQHNAKKHELIEKLAQQAGLFFFYKSTCPYCRRFAPILKDFADEYHIKVIPITMDGISDPIFPNSRIDQGQARKFKVKVTPSVFLVDPKTGKAIPVSYGLVSQENLINRLADIAKQILKVRS